MAVFFNQQKFPPLESINLTVLPTDQAAHYLNRRPQTLRIWAMRENGLIRPIRINGRLGWPTKDVKRILGIEQ